MQATFKHLGTVFVPMYPIASEKEEHIGVYMHDYLVVTDTGYVEQIRDKDYLPDGEYTVADNFLDTVTTLNEVYDDD